MAKRRGNKEGALWQRKNGTWRAQLNLDGERLNFTSKTKGECQTWIRDTLNKIDAGLTFEAAKISVAEFFSTWLTSIEPSLQPKTWRQYQQIFRDHIQPFIGHVKLIDLHPQQIQLLYSNRIEAGIGLRTVQLTHAVLRRALGQAEKMGLISRNPTIGTTPPRPKQKEMKFFDEVEVQQFLHYAKQSNDLHYAIYYLALTTGMRQSELLGLMWKDIDWNAKQIRIQRQLRKQKGGGYIFDAPKTKRGKRTISIGSSSLEILRQHLDKQFQQMQKAGELWQNLDLVFPSEFGTPLDQSNLSKRFKKLIADAGLPEIRFHDLRHTHVSLSLNNNIDIFIVSRRVGHAKPSFTLDVYGHLIPSKEQEMAETIDNLVTPTEAKNYTIFTPNEKSLSQ